MANGLRRAVVVEGSFVAPKTLLIGRVIGLNANASLSPNELRAQRI